MVDGEGSEIKPKGRKCRNTLLMEQLWGRLNGDLSTMQAASAARRLAIGAMSPRRTAAAHGASTNEIRNGS
jgi:hypothetical protein